MRAARRPPGSPRRARPSTSRPSCTGCAASSPRPRRPTARPASAGREPQPGLALLRLAQGQVDAAAAAIRRVVDEAQDRVARSRLLAAHVEIMLAAGDVDAAARRRRRAGGDRRRARRAVPARVGRPRAAARCSSPRATPARRWRALRQAWTAGRSSRRRTRRPRARVLIGLACRALGDEDGAAMELDAARWVFQQLGAAPDLAARRRARPTAAPPSAAAG